jgi:hypothetical protein
MGIRHEQSPGRNEKDVRVEGTEGLRTDESMWPIWCRMGDVSAKSSFFPEKRSNKMAHARIFNPIELPINVLWLMHE